MNTTLPAYGKKSEFQVSLRQNRVTLTPGETGSGKSTQLPQYADEMGHEVFSTQPRVLAAKGVSRRVASEMGQRLGGYVGYRTGEGSLWKKGETRIMFGTDALMAVIAMNSGQWPQTLMIDEVHEWNTHIEVLVALSRMQLAKDPNFNLVLKSATMPTQDLAVYFQKAVKEVGIIEIPGRTFPVKWHHRAASELVPTIKELIAKGKNVLVFQPGTAEIYATIRDLDGEPAKVLPLHGELEVEDQDKCFEHYALPKVIVATNIAQTSITIDDINAVVDSGLERRIDVEDGVEGLYILDCSKADCAQRGGRAGRVMDGDYYLCSDLPWEQRHDYTVAEILRRRLDKVVLQLMAAGLDPEGIEFFHQPDPEMIKEAKRLLSVLGFLTEDGNVTKMGRRANKLPVGVKAARMIIEGESRGCLEEAIILAALMETGSLRFYTKEYGRAWEHIPGVKEEYGSDFLVELLIYRAAQDMEQRGEARYFAESGISRKNYFAVKKLVKKIKDALLGKVNFTQQKANPAREDLLACVIAGFVDHLYKYQRSSRYGAIYADHIEEKQLSRDSVARKSEPEWVVADPFDIEVRDGVEIEMLQWVTAVTPAQLIAVAPHLVTSRLENIRGGVVDGQICKVADKVTIFDHQEIGREKVTV